MRTPLVNLEPRADLKSNLWPAVAVVPWLCWAAEGDGVQSDRLKQLGCMAMLARHWNILPALGLPTPPSCDWLRPSLTRPSITAIPLALHDNGGGDDKLEEEYSEESDEEDPPEEEEREEAGPSKRQRRVAVVRR